MAKGRRGDAKGHAAIGPKRSAKLVAEIFAEITDT
jgi:hypothetical protein